ncbi:TIGR02678 family protein [Nocardia sp. alder85J]|uniref:TIGR02678 family protein n=1 Tax=Nocardia sp. alder85J TaxID=2862949 RepID=UPI001CD7935A|nr:TIGR02678 family protein [Nocardia sp. alder85J]MCX4092741.1 TIGR02678 family protein [Nocardia sp. alder85J]
MHARGIAPLALDSYQRAARVVLANHLVTRTYPDRIALPLIRRWATELREDLAELFGYRLEVTETTARLFPVTDRLDPGRPARTPAERVFDRRRYAYLALALAALGRAGDQITLSELADQVAAYATRVDGLELATDRAADRDAFVDAVAWLSARGAVTLADGDAGGWAADPEAGEALYDIDRSVVLAIFRPPRALQHLQSVTGLLAEGGTDAGAPVSQVRAAAARRVRRALVELPVVYGEELAADEQVLLGSEKLVAEVELLTGLRAERRAEGVALIDTSGRLSDLRFPSTGTLAQVALLLIGEIADRVLDIDDPVERRPRPAIGSGLAERLDAAIPLATVFEPLAVDSAAEEEDSEAERPPVAEHPFLGWAWIRETVQALTDRYGSTFAAQWQADVPALTTEAVALLRRLRLVQVVEPPATGLTTGRPTTTGPGTGGSTTIGPTTGEQTDGGPADEGGLLILPALARYRGAIVTVRTRAETELFASATKLGENTAAGGAS